MFGTIQHNTLWQNFVTDLKQKTILKNCQFITAPGVQFAEIPYLGGLTVKEIAAGVDLSEFDFTAKMLHIDRRFFTSQIVLNGFYNGSEIGEKIVDFYKDQLKKQIYVNLEKLVIDEIKSKVQPTITFSSRDAIMYEDLIQAASPI